MKCIALISGPFSHHLDHLAPLAYSLQVPLLVDTLEVYKLGKFFYPFVDIRHEVIDLFEISQSFDCLLVSTRHAKAELQAVFELYGKTMRFCFCPHGQSEKGLQNPEMLSIKNQDLVLFYGERQKKLVKREEYTQSHVVGNFRRSYYEEHKPFYDDLIEKNLFSSLPYQKTILYAPTWNDSENGTTFFDHTEELIDSLPAGYNLLIKIHPLLEKHAPSHVYQALGRGEQKKGVKFLLDFPLIYPLLNRTSHYLGDFSSISYDFLTFNRSMFFLKNRSPFATTCGTYVENVKQFYKELDADQTSYQTVREQLYNEAFAPHFPLELKMFFE